MNESKCDKQNTPRLLYTHTQSNKQMLCSAKSKRGKRTSVDNTTSKRGKRTSVDKENLRVTRVFGGSGWYVDTVTLGLSNGSVRGYGNTSWGGGKPNKGQDYHLDADDYIVAVTQYTHYEYLGAGIVFSTNAGRRLQVMGSQCKQPPRLLRAPAGHQVVGLQFEGHILRGLVTCLVPTMNHSGLRVANVFGGAGSYVDTVTLELSDGTRRGYGDTNWHNGRPNRGPHRLRDGDYIISVKQYHHGGYLGGGFAFQTHSGDTFEVAGSRCDRGSRQRATTLRAPPGHQVVGLTFRSSSLEALETCRYLGSCRRQWLRSICSDTATSSAAAVVSTADSRADSEAHHQLIEFFRFFPGLRRLIGAILIMFYDPNVAEAF